MIGTASQAGFDPSAVELPPAIHELIRRVVRRTRLWASERRDLRAELESHFREGFVELSREGLSPQQCAARLEEDFGNPELAARLIRRGKKRGRSMLWKTMTASGLSILVLAGAGGSYLAAVAIGRPQPTVDYVEKINEPIRRVPAEDRSWPILRDVILEFQPPVTQGEEILAQMPRPGEPLWPEAAAWVSTNRQLVPRLTEAASRPVDGFIYDNEQTLEFQRRLVLHKEGEAAAQELMAQASANGDADLIPPTISILLPHLTELRTIAKYLVLDSRQSLMRGDFSSAWQSLDSAHRLGIQLYESWTLIEQLVGRAISAQAMQEMRQVLYARRDQLTAGDLAMIRASLANVPPLSTIGKRCEGERLFFLDVVQYLFTDDGNGNGRMIPSQFVRLRELVLRAPGDEAGAMSQAGGLAMAAVHADRRDTVAKYFELWDEAMEKLSLPLYDARRADAYSSLTALQEDATASRRFAVIAVVLPDLLRADTQQRTSSMAHEAMRTIAALEQHRLDHGAYPDRLGALVPACIAEAPTDAYSGVYLRYELDASGDFRLYSVGENLVDDGGSTAPLPATASSRPVPRDLVYWPAPVD